MKHFNYSNRKIPTTLGRIVCTSLVLSACTIQQVNSQADKDATSPVVVSATPPNLTAGSLAVPTPTVLVTSTVTQMSLPVDVPDDWFLGTTSTDCELPCWQEIEVNQSTVEETLMALTKLYGTPLVIDPLTVTPPNGFDGIMPGWLLGDLPEYESFGGSILFDNQTRVLEALTLSWVGSRFQPYLSLQRIFQDLGIPTHMLISHQLGGQGITNANVQFFVLYENGLSLFEAMSLPVVTGSGSDAQSQLIELCIDNTEGIAGGRISFTGPIPTDLNKLTPVQHYVLGGYGDLASLPTIEEIFNVTSEDIAQSALQEDPPCLYAPIPDP